MAISPVSRPSDATNTSIEQLAAARLGVGPGVTVDPTTGQVTMTAPSGGFQAGQTYTGSDGKTYKATTVNGQVRFGNTGSDGVFHYAPEGVSVQAPAGSAPQTLGLDPTHQLETGISGAQGLNQALQNNQVLQQAGQHAGGLASGQTGKILAKPIQAAIDATQGRINDQANDLGIVRASANGTGPSAAEHLAQSQLDSNIRSQSALAATARGGNIAAAMRTAANSGTQQSLQSAQQISAMRAQEQLNAQGLLTTGANNLTTAQGSLGNQQQNLGAMQAGLIQNGTQLQSQVGGQQTNNDINGYNAIEGANNNYAQYLAGLYATSAGITPQYTGQGVQAQIANQNNNTQLIGAGTAAAGAALGAFIK